MKAYWLVPLLLFAAQAHAEGKSQEPAAKPKMVCYSDPATGSHIKKKICVTEAQDAARRKADQEAMRNTVNNRRGPNKPVSGR